jgi:hypothetical protein
MVKYPTLAFFCLFVLINIQPDELKFFYFHKIRNHKRNFITQTYKIIYVFNLLIYLIVVNGLISSGNKQILE